MKEDYKYYIANLGTGAILDEVPFVNVTWSKKIKAAGTFTGTAVANTERPLFDIRTMTTPGNRALYVVRKNIVVWGGIIWDREYTQGEGKMTITALGFEVYLAHRVLWRKRSYVDVDIFDIVRDLLNAVLVDFDPNEAALDGTPSPYYTPPPAYIGRPDHADIGFKDHLGNNTLGETMTNDEDFRGNEMKYLSDIIDALSDNKNFFEYRITSSYVSNLRRFENAFNLYKPEANGSAAPNTFDFPGSILNFTWTDSMEGAATRYWVTGAGDGPDKLIAQWTNDTVLDQLVGDQHADYVGYPLYDEVESSKHGSTKNIDRLEGFAETYGHQSRPPLVDWELTVHGGKHPEVDSYLPGEWARFVINDTAFGPRESFTRRIVEMTVTVPDDEKANESVKLTLTNVAGPASDLA